MRNFWAIHTRILPCIYPHQPTFKIHISADQLWDRLHHHAQFWVHLHQNYALILIFKIQISAD